MFTKGLRPRQTIRPSRSTLVLVVLLGVAACSSDNTYLPALLADPMSIYSHPAVEEKSSLEIPQDHQDLWGAIQNAHVFRSYVVEGSSEPVTADMVAKAEAAGWDFEPDPPTPAGDDHGFKSWYATKEFPEGDASLSITSGPFSIGDFDIGMQLEFDEVE